MGTQQRPSKLFAGLEPELRAHRRLLALAIGAAVTGQLLALALPFLVRQPIDALASGASLPGLDVGLWVILGAVVLFAVARGYLNHLEVTCGGEFAYAVLRDVRLRMLDALTRRGPTPSKRAGVGAGAVLLRFIGDAGSLQSWLARACVTAPADILTLLGVFVALGLIHVQLLAVALAPLLLAAPICLRFNSPVRSWTRRMRRRQSRLSASLLREIHTPSQGAGAPGDFHGKSQRRIRRISEAAVSRTRLEGVQSATVVASFALALGFTALVGATLVSAGQLGHGDLAAAVWILLLARAPGVRLARANVIHQRARVARRRIREFLRAPLDRDDGAAPLLVAQGG